MKKILSMLLVALMLMGMLPMTPIHAHAATAGESTTYTFSNYTAGTQYAEETHALDSEVTLKIVDCHLTTQLRIYDSSSNDGIAIVESAVPVTAIGFNMGYKKCTLNIYGSNDDGATWTSIGSIATTSTSYLNYSLDFAGEKYSALKLDASGAQLRIASMTLTFAKDCSHEWAEATCTAPITCNLCGETEGEALGHTEVADEAVDPTCTEVGKTAGSHCSVCNEVIVAQEDVPMIDHTYEDGACTVCGAEDPAVCAHTNTTTETVAATCTEAGAINTVCSDCGETISTEEIPALGHTEVTDAAVAATCTATGLTKGSHCSVCNEVIVARTVTEMVDHNYVDGTCNVCGAIGVVIPAVPESGNYVLVTDINEILSGGKFVIAVNYNNVNYAMSVATSNKPSAVEVAVSNDMVAYEEGKTPVWTIGKYGDNIALVNGEEYLGYNSSTNFATKTEPYAWVVAAGENNTFTVTSSAVTNRAIIYRNTGVFAPYATSNFTDAEYNGYLSFYKLTEGDVEVITSTVSIKENNTDVSSQEVVVGGTFTLPEATVAAPEGYTFAGWVEGVVTDTAIAPETIYAAGSEYKVNDAVTFYALYSRSQVVEDGTIYQLVSSADTLAAGDKIVIAAADYEVAMSTTQNNNNRGQATVAKSESQITFNNDVQILTLEAGTVDGTFAFNTGSGYLYAASSGSNHLKTKDELDDNGSWLITIAEDGTATIVAQGTNSRNVMQYNQSSGLFACYGAASQKAVVLYKETTGATTVNYYTTCGHENGIVTDAAVDATCTETGLTEGSHCELCGTVFVAQETVDKLRHINEEVITAPTCTESGYTTYTCTVCGSSYVGSYTDAIGHSWNDATCTAPKTCSVCGETEGEALGHSWNDATCTAPKTCSVCGETEGEALGHSYGDWVVVKEATLAETGEQQKTCSGCDDVISEEIPCLAGDVESWSLTLNSGLRVNFRIEIPDIMQQSAQISITVADGEPVVSGYESWVIVEVTENSGIYEVSIPVAAAQMLDEIKVKILYNGEASVEKTYTVEGYARSILSDPDMEQYHQLVKEMLNYGAAAQLYFDYRTDGNLPTYEIEEKYGSFGEAEVPKTDEREMVIDGSVDGISFYAASLVHNNEVAVRLYFKVDGNVEDYIFSRTMPEDDGEVNPLNPVKSGDYYYIEFAEIYPDMWNRPVTLYVIKGYQTLSVEYSPMNYIVRMNAKGSDSLKALLKAMYNYHLAAFELNGDDI